MYSNTKLCNILFTRVLAQKLKGTGITVNSLHPGVVQTDIWRRLPIVVENTFLFIAGTFFKVKNRKI